MCAIFDGNFMIAVVEKLMIIFLLLPVVGEKWADLMILWMIDFFGCFWWGASFYFILFCCWWLVFIKWFLFCFDAFCTFRFSKWLCECLFTVLSLKWISFRFFMGEKLGRFWSFDGFIVVDWFFMSCDIFFFFRLIFHFRIIWSMW